MSRLSRLLASLTLTLGVAGAARADVSPTELYERVSPSFVAVKYTWDYELQRQDLTGPGIVLSEDGLVVCPLAVFNSFIPDAQMSGFKIIIPSQEKDAEEIDAVFVGRDERTNLAYLRPKTDKEKADKKADEKASDNADKPEGKDDPGNKDADKSEKASPAGDDQEPASAEPAGKKGKKGKGKKKAPAPESSTPKADASSEKSAGDHSAHKWVPIKFEESKFEVGQPLWSVGVLPEAASFKTYILDSKVACMLRGETPQVLVSGGLCGTGAAVFTADGKAVGMVNFQNGQPVFLHDAQSALAAIVTPPKFFTPASDFLWGLSDPPVAGQPMELPWIGVPALTGLNKDLAEFYGLKNQPAVQVNDVVPDAPAAKAGIKAKDVIFKVDGEALERGDEVDELPIILRRRLLRKKVGDTVTLTVIRKPKEPPQEFKVTLEKQPKPQNLAERFYAEDLGFGVRELVFQDTYARQMPADSKGVLVSVIKQQSNAESGRLQGNGSARSDVIIALNGEPVEGLEQFKKAYKAFREAKPKDPVVLVVRRGGREDTVRIEPPQ